MRLIDEATGIIYRTLEQGEVLTYRGSFKDCFEAQHSLVKTGEKCEGWQLDSPLEAPQRAIPPQGVRSRVALKLEEEYQENLKRYNSAQIDVNALARAEQDRNAFINAIKPSVDDRLAQQRKEISGLQAQLHAFRCDLANLEFRFSLIK